MFESSLARTKRGAIEQQNHTVETVLTVFVDTATPYTRLEFFVGFSFAIGNRSRREIDWPVCTASYRVCLKHL